MTRRVDALPEGARPIIRSRNQRITIHAIDPITSLPPDNEMTVWVTNANRPDAKPLETLLGSALVFGAGWDLVEAEKKKGRR